FETYPLIFDDSTAASHLYTTMHISFFHQLRAVPAEQESTAFDDQVRLFTGVYRQGGIIVKVDHVAQNTPIFFDNKEILFITDACCQATAVPCAIFILAVDYHG